MSLITEILNMKKELKSCQTIVTTESGTKYIESRNDSGVLKTEKLNEKSSGFVVDEKLDLQIAEILEYLCLSSQDVAQDVDLLTKNHITHVLSIGVSLPPLTEPSYIKFIKFDLLDEPTENLEGVLIQCCNCINEIRETSVKSKILVHCNAGFSRAPTIVSGYLMKSLGLSLFDALEMIRSKRHVKPNDGFMKQLKDFEIKLKKENEKAVIGEQ